MFSRSVRDEERRHRSTSRDRHHRSRSRDRKKDSSRSKDKIRDDRTSREDSRSQSRKGNVVLLSSSFVCPLFKQQFDTHMTIII